MSSSNIDTLTQFDISTLPNLDVAVLGALELFVDAELPHITLDGFKKPLVVGSGNAAATGKIMFADSEAVFGSESTAVAQLAAIPSIDAVVIVSASGGKHAPILVDAAHTAGKPAILITNTSNSDASKKLDLDDGDKEYIYPKNREPYTYNTSTYMGMILGVTAEDPSEIMQHIQEQVATIEWPDFSKYQKYYIIVPTKFEGIIRLLNIKFIELFGREIARDIETIEYIKHATTVVPSKNELFISMGVENEQWGEPEHRLHIPFMPGGDYASAMAISYFVVAQIQAAYPHLFKDNIEHYTSEISKVFGATIRPIVE